MKETFSEDFKKIFLIKFTEQLIRNSEKIDIRKLQGIIAQKEKKKFKKLSEKDFVKIEKLGIKLPIERFPSRQARRMPMVREMAKPTLFIPESKLPEHLEYLKPMPTAGVEIDLWKLNPLIKDRAVRVIEVNPDEKVVVTGAMGTKTTDIILNKEDINRVINEFAKISKIPIEEGVYRVVVGNLILSAVISEVIGSKFIIRKMIIPAKPKQPMQTLPAMPRIPR
ncbi:MAG: hypothetical protein M1416_01975 [Candidatus Pacearchaeota archaeon]|nr:hypothetical protein [Candidatus Pacearchaeota archaeon]